MASNIGYVTETWSPVSGCTPVSRGCQNCYAARVARRFPHTHTKRERIGSDYNPAWPDIPVPFSTVVCHPERLEIPLHWRKPRVVLVPSMGDLFHDSVDVVFLAKVFAIMARAKQHTFLLLTRRAERMREWLGHELSPAPLPNVWLGISAEDQDTFDERSGILQTIPAAHYWVSLAPLLGPIEMNPWTLPDVAAPHRLPPIEWVVAECESGPKPRYCNEAWLVGLARQCEAAGVPYFCKQGHDLGGRVVKMPELAMNVGDDVEYRVWAQTPWARGTG